MSARPTLRDVHQVDLAVRARIVRGLCAATADVDERRSLFEAAFIPPKPPGVGISESQCAISFMEDADGQLVLPLEAAATEFRRWLEEQPQPAYIGGAR